MYEGEYTTAITQDGAIVADFITTGTLNAAEIDVINLIANHVVTDDPEGTSAIIEIIEAKLTLSQSEKTRSVVCLLKHSDGVVSGAFLAASGNYVLPPYGTTITNGLQDSEARLTWLDDRQLTLGRDSSGDHHGNVYSAGAYLGKYVSADLAYNGEIHAGTLYIKQVAPAGQLAYDIEWKLVTLSGGGTAYALCRKT